MNVLSECMYACHVYFPGAHRNYRRSLISLNLELRLIVNYHVGTKDWSEVLCKSSTCTNSWVISPLTQFLAIVQHKKECVWMEFVYEDLSWEWWSKLITNKTYAIGWGSGIHRTTKKHLNGQLPPESEITFIVLSIFALKCMLLEEN